MIRYADGAPAYVGDTVSIDNGERQGRIAAVIEHEADLADWGVEEPGLMIESEYYGLLFVGAADIPEMECRLISRGKSP
jgi:hypothetical protein